MPSIPVQDTSSYQTAFTKALDFCKSAFHKAGVGIAIVSLAGEFLWVNRVLCATWGYSIHQITILRFQDITYPEDLPDNLRLSTQLLEGKIPAFTMEKRYVCQTGEIVWAKLSVSLMRSPSGQPLFFISHVMDLTVQKRAEERLWWMNVRFTKIVENLQQGVLIEDESSRILMVNQSFCDLFRLETSPATMQGQASNIIPLTILADPIAFTDQFNQLRTQHIARWGEMVILREGRVLEQDYLPITYEGESLGHLWLYRDTTHHVNTVTQIERQVSQLQIANSVLQQMAFTDVLTGLNNRRAFMDQIEMEIQKAIMNQTWLSLVLMDIDEFKQYNDEFGHPAGDAVLQEVARILRDTLRESDYVARFGGEEFVIILSQTDAYAAVKVSERVRDAIAWHEWHRSAVTVSLGVATFRDGGQEGNGEEIATHLIAVTDKALYHAKHAGRNCVVHFSEVESEAE